MQYGDYVNRNSSLYDAKVHKKPEGENLFRAFVILDSFTIYNLKNNFFSISRLKFFNFLFFNNSWR